MAGVAQLQASGVSSASGDTASATILTGNVPVRGGSGLVAFVFWTGAGITVTGVIDSAGNQYFDSGAQVTSPAGTDFAAMYYASNAIGIGSNAIQVNFSGTPTFRRAIQLEFIGAGPSFSDGGVGTTTSGTSATFCSAPVTTHYQYGILAAGVTSSAASSAPYVALTGYTIAINSVGSDTAALYALFNGKGSYSPGFTFSSTGNTAWETAGAFLDRNEPQPWTPHRMPQGA